MSDQGDGQCPVCGGDYDRTEKRGYAITREDGEACVGEDAVYIHSTAEADPDNKLGVDPDADNVVTVERTFR
jgi:hypothetical protein